MKTLLLVFTSIVVHCFAFAQNPISPPGMYIADPSAKVFSDGKLYIYGSVDESCNYYCSWRHHVMVTDDMKSWKIHENQFWSKGESDQVPYNNALLFAPDAQEFGDTTYLYYCQPNREAAEGVAVANNPTGPFINGQKLHVGGHEQIDPAVFVDDDGQAYYLWGQFSLKMAKLNPDRRSLDLSSLKDSILTESEHFFHEGAYLTKRNGIYYMVYADISRANMPTCIGYATSKSPFGPYTYGGVIIDNDNCNPGNWNNHGSIAEFNGQWYVFYHRSTHGCNTMRKASVEPIYFKDDGSIPEVEMTSQGAGDPLPAKETIDAERACLYIGDVQVQALGESNEMISHMMNADKVAYKYINFNDGVKKLTLRIRPGKDGGRIVVNIDQPWHKQLAIIDVPAEEVSDWQDITVNVDETTGIHPLWLTFYGHGNEMFEIDWLKFD